jgi:hypothetical protein
MNVPYRRLGFFLLLSILDLLLTLHLIGGSTQVYESNPIARWFFDLYGWLGLTAFKVILVSLVLSLIVIIYRNRPRTARRLLAFGCAALVLVVAYSGTLAGYVASQSELSDHTELSALKRHNLQLDRLLKSAQHYLHLKQQLGLEVVAGRKSLSEAVQELVASRHVDPAWLSVVRSHHPELTLEQCLALNFVKCTVESPGEGACRIELKRRLRDDLSKSFGVPAFPTHSSGAIQ